VEGKYVARCVGRPTLKALEDENAKLKKLLAERCSTTHAEGDQFKKMVTPVRA